MPSPPSLPPPPLKIELTFAVVIAGDLESFDETAQSNYKTKLAELLEGIEPFDIELTVSVASLRVAATITPETTSAADASLGVLTSLAASTDDLSSALGVTVEEVAEMPSVITMEGDSSLGSTVANFIDNNQGLLLALSAGGTALVIVVLFICLCRRWRASMLREEVVRRFFGSRDIDAFDVELDVEGMTLSKDGVQPITHNDFAGKDGRSPNSSKGSSAKSKAASTLVTSFSSCSNSSNQNSDSISSSPGVRRQRALSAMTQWEMTSADIVWREKIGHGSFGTVFTVECGGETLAAKRMDVSSSEIDRQVCPRQEAILPCVYRALSFCSLSFCCLTLSFCYLSFCYLSFCYLSFFHPLFLIDRSVRRCKTVSSVSSVHCARRRMLTSFSYLALLSTIRSGFA